MKLGARKNTDLIDIYSYWTYPKYLTKTKSKSPHFFFSKKKILYIIYEFFFSTLNYGGKIYTLSQNSKENRFSHIRPEK
jgi:hypothetical protein